MAYIDIGSGNDLILETPTRKTINWNDNFLSNYTTPIVQHDHTGSGNGRLITTAAITDSSITEDKILLSNDAYLPGRNAADLANINMLKVDTSDHLYFGADISNLSLINNTYLLGRNNADDAYINALKINASDYIELGVKTVHNGNMELKGDRIAISKTFTIANTQTNSNITGLTVTESAGKCYTMLYSIYIDATADLVESGEIEWSYDGTNWNQDREYSHDDSLVTFDINSGQMRYSSDTYSGYSDGTLTYQLIEK